MSRQARLVLPGVPLHVVQRGNNRADCFFAERDYRLYLGLLEELCAKFHCAVHAYALMTNHVHLLLTPARKEGAALLMKQLGQRYVQYVNRTHGRSGTLWGGRFRSSIVQEQSYLLRCYRYIELNPVRAGMVTHPRDYAWSSYRSNGDGTASSLLTPHEEYVALGRCHDERLGVYRSLFSLAMDMHDLMEIRSALKGGFAFGNERFKKQMTAMLGRRVQPGQSGRPKRLRHAAGNRGLSPDFLR